MAGNKISKRQIYALLMLEITGVGFVFMPRLALMLAWRDGLTAIILAAIAAAMYSLSVIKIIKTYGNRALFDICGSVLGNFLAILLRCGFIVKTVLFTAFCMRMFAGSAVRVAEGDISVGIIMIAMALCILYAVVKGREARGRLGEIFIFPFFAVIIFVLLCGIQGVRRDNSYSELLPVLSENGWDITKGAVSLFMWFYPIEYVLMSLPYISQSSGSDSESDSDISSGSGLELELAKGCARAVLLSGLFIAGVFALTVVRFGAAQMGELDYPVLEMMYSVSLPSSFIERQEGLMLGIWIIGVFFTLGAGIYHSGICACEMIKGISHSIASAICAAGAVIIGFLPGESGKIFEYMVSVLLIAEGLYLIVLPLVLCLAKLWEGKKNEQVG